MTRWYRAYEGTVTDAKLAEAAIIAGCSRSVTIATWHAILENAASLNDGGRIDIPARRVAAILVEPLDIIETLFAAFESIGLIGDSRITAWKRRQYESDNSTERSRKHREHKRNGDATLQQQHATPPETETETETETEKEEDISLRSIDDWPSDFRERFWAEVPRKIGKQGAIRVLERIRKRRVVSWNQLISAIKAYAATADPAFTKHPETWLSKGCWDDELQKKPAAETDTDWDNILEFYKKTGVWSRHVGPEPGMSGCRAPADLLQKHGIAA